MFIAPFWIAATTAEICERLATMWFWGTVVPAMMPEPLQIH